MAYIYLLHFDRPVAPGRHTCQHYLGFAKDLAARIQSHETGNGARLLQVVRERGISFVVARAWLGDRSLERRLKNRKSAPRLCPVCSDAPAAVTYAEELSAAEIEDLLIPF